MKKIVIILIGLAVLVSGTSFSDARISAAAFDNRTIIIGTHAISLDGINGEIVKKAQASMAFKEGEAIKEQKNIYYKSDLSKGTWFDITSSTSIQNVIESGDNVVTNDLIDGLKLTHYTNAKGATIEFSTGNTVAVHQINDKSNPQNMLNELTAVSTQVDVVNGERKADYDLDDDEEDALKSDLSNQYMLLNDAFDPLSDPDLEGLKHEMDVFEKEISYLKNDLNAPDEAIEAVVSIKAKLQTAYDIKCYELEKARLEKLAGKMNPSKAKESIDALWAGVNKINTTLDSLKGDLGGDAAGTILYDLQREYADDVYQKIINDQPDQVLESLNKVLSVDRIYATKIVDIPLELAVLGEGQVRASQAISKIASQTDTEAYTSAKGNGATALVLKNIMDGDIDLLTGLLEEAVAIKDFTSIRLQSDGERAQVTKTLLDNLKAADKALNVDGDYYYDYHKLLSDRIQSLESELATTNANQDPAIQGKQSELAELKETMKQLKEDYLEAVDQGDLDLVDAIEGAIDALEEDINALQAGTTEAYKALMDKSLTDGGLSDEDQATMAGLAGLISPLDQDKVEDVKNAFDGLASAIGREDVFGLKACVDAYKSAKESASDLLSPAYFEDLDAKVDESFKGKYKALIAQGRYQTASLLMDGLSSAVDTEAVTAGMDKGGASALNKLLTQSEDYKTILSKVDSAKTEAQLAKSMTETQNMTEASKKQSLQAYEASLDQYQSSEKQRLIIEILLRRTLLSNERYRGDVSLEKEKAAYIQQLRSLDGQKYSKEDLVVIEAKEDQFVKEEDETIISALQVIVETYNVPLFNPVLEREGVYFIPTRTLSEAFGGRVQWLQESQMAIIDYMGQHMELYTGTKNIRVNDIPKTLENPILLIEEKTYVPMDFIETYYKQLYLLDDQVFIVFSSQAQDQVERILGGD
jgi:hypothetical protein